jgi:UDP-N-acetylglucosamine:LPS N-acetylglucosamine transferase
VAIDEAALTAEVLSQSVADLLADRGRLVAMGENARAFARPDAARLLADLLFEAEGTR